MATVIRTGIAPILASIQTQLLAVCGPVCNLTADHIVVISREEADVPHVMGDQDVLLRPRGLAPTKNIGGGRTDRRVRRRLSVYVRTRLALDETDRDFQWLTNATLGHFTLEESVVDALDTFQPTNSNGDALTCEPIEWVPSSEPRKDRNDPSWGVSVLEFDVQYLISLNQAMQ